ncbi:MAG: hypothetical protein HY051_01580 [Candidatus Aenigmarchaeota archaeon]|nr:hypothetical protein [Candidatus Aenigmarchaeota archaeon]
MPQDYRRILWEANADTVVKLTRQFDKGLRIADVGIGTGYGTVQTLENMAAAGMDIACVTVFEPAAELVKAARRRLDRPNYHGKINFAGAPDAQWHEFVRPSSHHMVSYVASMHMGDNPYKSPRIAYEMLLPGGFVISADYHDRYAIEVYMEEFRKAGFLLDTAEIIEAVKENPKQLLPQSRFLMLLVGQKPS